MSSPRLCRPSRVRPTTSRPTRSERTGRVLTGARLVGATGTPGGIRTGPRMVRNVHRVKRYTENYSRGVWLLTQSGRDALVEGRKEGGA